MLLDRCRSRSFLPLACTICRAQGGIPVAHDSYGVPPIPIHLAEFPTVGGLVVPNITLRHRNGAAALGLVDYRRMVHCFRERCCGVCGEPVEGRLVFLMRSFDLARSMSCEPG